MNTKILIVASTDHPLHAKLTTHYTVRTIDEALASFDTYDIIFDLSVLRTKRKILFLKELSRTTKGDIISDLTLSWGEKVLDSLPNVNAAVSTLFFSPTNAFEYFIRPKQSIAIENAILDFSKIMNMSAVLHSDLKLSFHYPRVISMIINEAYFGLDENLATTEAIDLALKNGVNYPLGPCEWGNKIGLHFVALLLTELYKVTGDPRYRLSLKLKLEGKI